MSLEQIYEEIFRINPKIRFIGIYHKGELHGKMRQGVKSYLDEDETKRSLFQAVKRWQERRDWAPKIGRPIYSLTMYEVVKRITMEVSEDLIILVSTEIECDHEKILSELIDFKKRIKKILD